MKRFAMTIISICFLIMPAITAIDATSIKSGALAGGKDEAKNLPHPELSYKTGELLVKYRDDVKMKSAEFYRTRHGITTLKTIDSIGVHHLKLPDNLTVIEALELYRNDPDVLYAEPNYRRMASLRPDDTFFYELWGLHNTGQSGGVVGADIDAQRAWDITTGGDVIVAVIDTGVNYNHEDIGTNIWKNPGEVIDNNDNDRNDYIDDIMGWDFVDEDNDPMDEDDNDDVGHGTHVAGTIAAVGDNNLGITGICWSARIMPLRVLDGDDGGYDIDIAEAIDYAAANGAAIINLSLGGPDEGETLRIAIQNAASCVVVCAAGNYNQNNNISHNYPSCYPLPNIISVASTNNYDHLADGSNYGDICVDVGAPGVRIYSTALNGSYAWGTGTSMATPHVAGTAALLKAYKPSITNVEIIDSLFNNVDQLESLNGMVATGGRTNAYLSLIGLELSVFQFEASRYHVDEDAGEIEIIVNRTGDGILEEVNVECIATNGTADAGDYVYEAEPEILEWGFGESEPQTVTIGIVNDNEVEGNETLLFALRNPSVGAELGERNETTLYILDREPGTLGFDNTSLEIDENSGQASIFVTRSNGSEGAASLQYRVEGGTADRGNDYTIENGVLNWTDREAAPKAFTVSVTNDMELEEDETINLVLEGAGGRSEIGVNNRATLTILDNDGDNPGILQFQEAAYIIEENPPTRSNVEIKVTRTLGQNGAIRVNYAPTGGTAQASDYNNATGELYWTDRDDDPKSFTVTINNDFLSEDNETLTIEISSPTNNASIGQISTTEITIIDDDSNDSDGVRDIEENNGPNSGDGDENNVVDSLEVDVATFENINDDYITIISPQETELADVREMENPSPGDSPSMRFPSGFYKFVVQSLESGSCIELSMLLHNKNTSLISYYKYGPTPDDLSDHWYEFLYDGRTGAEIFQEAEKTRISLHLCDGLRGDDDLAANGAIYDIGGPAANKSQSGSGGGGGGGGGCFIKAILK